MTQKNSGELMQGQVSERPPLLDPADLVVPLSTDDLVYIANVMTSADQAPDDTAQQALAFYRRKEVVRLIGNATFSATGMSDRLDDFESQLPAKASDPKFMQDLVRDFSSLSEPCEPTERQLKLPDLLGVRARREHKQRITELREKSINNGNMLSIHDLRQGDEIAITSGYRLPRGEGEILGRSAKNVISGSVTGFETVEGLDVLALKVSRDVHRGSMEFVHAVDRTLGAPALLDGQAFVKGQTIYISGTTNMNRSRPNPSQIVVGQALEIFDSQGERSSKHVVFREAKDFYGSDDARMLPVTGMKVNGDEVLHKRV